MREKIEQRLRALARRAGISGVPTPVLVAGMALLSVAVVAAVLRWWPQPTEAGALAVQHARSGGSVAAAKRSPTTDSTVTPDTTAQSGTKVCVHVVGAVHHPGVYTLADGSRVEAAVDVAGGMTAAAAPAAINLAAKLQDGEQVVVPTEAEVRSGAAPSSAGPANASSTGGASTAAGAKVNLNTADATQLDALPGIGPSTAAKIVADRQSNGPFKTVEDLGRVPGIGPKKLDQLRALVVVR